MNTQKTNNHIPTDFKKKIGRLSISHYFMAVIVLLFGGIGLYTLTNSQAATFTVAREAEQGVITGNTTTHSGVASASNTSAVEFGGGNVTTPVPNGVPGNWSLKFNDDFDGNSLDLTKWILCSPSFDNSCTPKNQECPYNASLTNNNNVAVSNGQLHLIATKTNGQIRSSMIATGPNKFNSNQPGYKSFQYTYGIYEGRVRFPKGNGFWPSMWQLPDQSIYGDWPNSGEYDVVEIAGNNPTVGHFTTHWGGNSCGNNSCQETTKQIADASADFHTYALDWQPTSLTWYVDGAEVFKVTNAAAIKNHPFYIMANFAVGGTWPPLNGGPDASTPFPASMDIDYLRVWQHQ